MHGSMALEVDEVAQLPDTRAVAEVEWAWGLRADDRQKPVLQRQLQQKFCWFGNHCQYPYCPYWHAISTPHSAELKSFNKILPQHAQKSDILQSHLHSTIFFLKLTLPFFESYFFINPEKFSFKQRTKVNENEGENRHEHEK